MNRSAPSIGRLGRTTGTTLIVLIASLGVLTARADETRTYSVTRVTYFSHVLGENTTFDIGLPSDYAGEALPVLYFLHGAYLTHVPGSASPTVPVFTAANLPLLAPYRMAVVAPDVFDPNHSCSACGYYDGNREGQTSVTSNGTTVRTDGVEVGTPFERFFFSDLIPYIQSHYNVRRDRAGRGIAGFSMGGSGTGILATRHPDRFAFAWSMSGDLNLFLEGNPNCLLCYGEYGDLVMPQIGDPYTHEWRWRGVDPWTLAPNLVGEPIKVGINSGDGRCSDDPNSAQGVRGGCGSGHEIEALAYYNAVSFDEGLTDLGGTHETFLYGPYGHSPPDFVFRDHLYPALADAFAANLSERPAAFNYQSMDQTFSIWGYDVTVYRPNHEFVFLKDVAKDSLRVLGTGEIALTTPPIYEPDAPYLITFSSQATGSTTAYTDGRGRLSFTFQAGPDRYVDYRKSLEDAGQFSSPETDVAIQPA